MSGFVPDSPGAEVRVSPNFGPRRDPVRPDMILLHYTGMPDGPAAEDWLCDTASQVSSHYLVHENGRVVQMVRESDRAWHAGISSWQGHADINSASVGIEIVNPGHAYGYPDFPDGQIESLVVLCLDIVRRWDIAPERVLAHSDVAPGRKIDPGEKFPWRRLAEAGLGIWLEAGPPDARVLGPGDAGFPVEATQVMLALFGYGIGPTGAYDSRTETVVSAFQRHFRPERVDGIADASTLDVLQRLLLAVPRRAR
jgi:N-acetylmuramoyl-L-alanine amidase